MQDTTSADQVLLFLHIPKTAGTTLSDLIYDQYAFEKPVQADDAEGYLKKGIYYVPLGFHGIEEERLLYVKNILATRIDEIRAIAGHFYFGLHEFLPKPSTYITVLRHPVDRVISLYYHTLKCQTLKWPTNPPHYHLVSEKISLDEFVSGISCREAENDQTRRLSGWDHGSGRCSVEMLERAKANLRKHFPVVGLTERFDETLVLLKRTFGWKHIYNFPRQVNRDRPNKESLSPDTLNLIAKYNELDIQLYKYAEGMLDELISNQGVDFEKDLNAFRNLMRSRA